MKSFRTGLRQRHPLVLVAAALLLIPLLLGIEQLFTSGAWTNVPLKYWISSTRDTYAYVSWNTADIKHDPPREPTVVLVGGSSARESIVSGDALSEAVKAEGGPAIAARNLASPKQTIGGSLAIIDNLPDAPTTAVIGVNLARLYQPPAKNTADVYGRGLVLQNEALVDYVERTSGSYSVHPHILPGIFQFLTTRAAALSRDSFSGESPLVAYNLHSMDSRATMSDAKLARIRRWANRERTLLALERNLGGTIDLLDETIATAQRRGVDVVLLELPYNPAAVGAGFEASKSYYQRALRDLAGRRGVTYVDFNGELSLEREDFIDFSHLRPSGRAVWQQRLAEELVRLYEDGTIAGGEATSRASLTSEARSSSLSRAFGAHVRSAL